MKFLDDDVTQIGITFPSAISPRTSLACPPERFGRLEFLGLPPISTIMRKSLLSVLVVVPYLRGAGVDPALAGSWRLDAPGSQLVWQVAADGHYQLWGSLTDSGTLEASGGKWTMVSAVTNARQNGTYSINGHVLSTDGPLGKSQWQADSPQNLANGLVPAGLPKMTQDALAVLQRTVPDAVLVMVEVKDPAPVDHPIELRFYSKKTNHVYVSSGVGGLDLGPPAFPEPALPASYIDLPRAVELARANGMKGLFGHAELRVVSPPQGMPVAVWQVAPKVWNGELARSIDAVTGKALDTARLTPMTGTDGELQVAVDKLKGAVQGEGGQTGGGGDQTGGRGGKVSNKAAIANLGTCGDQETFVDADSDYDKPVNFPAIHISIPVYTFSGPENVYVPLNPLRDTQVRELSQTARRFAVSFPPGYVIVRGFFDFHSIDVVKSQLEQMAATGCR